MNRIGVYLDYLEINKFAPKVVLKFLEEQLVRKSFKEITKTNSTKNKHQIGSEFGNYTEEALKQQNDSLKGEGEIFYQFKSNLF